MEEHFDQRFERLTGTLPAGAYENCSFTGCDFSGAALAGIHFIDCRFDGCNLSLTKVEGTLLRDIKFTDCKALGLHFDTCSGFGLAVSFTGCVLDNSSFYKVKLRKTRFDRTQLREVDFTDADLTGAVFDGCDLRDANFDNTVLEKADLRAAAYYTIDPTRNRLKKAKFSWPGVAGLLTQFDIELSA